MTATLKVLCVHGLGNHQTSPWKEEWTAAVKQAVGENDDLEVVLEFVEYDPVFKGIHIDFFDYIRTLAKLSLSGLQVGTRRARGWTGVSERVRWTAGYVVAWVESRQFQVETTKLFLDHVARFQPNVVLAHSLGSLVTYNALATYQQFPPTLRDVLRSMHYVTFGSQINNPFVVGNLTNGRVIPPPVAHWHHLFNEHDDIFTREITLQGVENFSQLRTPFDLPGVGDHSAVGYITHNVTRGSFWRPIAALTRDSKAFGGQANPWKRAYGELEPKRRALLVGINDYPNPSDRLDGCVNDVFTMSAVLQECGFPADSIRTCLNERATAAGILERLEWLLEDAGPRDELVFYYSGHGARIPEYGAFEEPDRLTETLVPWDFDWTREKAISDEQIYGLYSQLPYHARLAMIFDCCHAGSMHRQGGARARAITPPDDIRHRQLKWDLKAQMWVDRDFARINPEFATASKTNRDFFGPGGATVRLGRAAPLRVADREIYRAARAATGTPVGPYLPLILEACAEDEFAYEYRHGTTSYGAFTFCLASLLRELKDLTFTELVNVTASRLRDLKYKQAPQILGPTTILQAKIPWNTGSAADRSPPIGVAGGSTPRLSG